MAIDIDSNILQSRFERLCSIRWGSAPCGSRRSRMLFFSYYDRLMPFLLAWCGSSLPNDGSIIAAFARQLSFDEALDIEERAERVCEAARAQRTNLPPLMVSLIKLVLVCSVLRSRNQFSSFDDPAEPLLDLFEAGYLLNTMDDGIDIVDSHGKTLIPLPTHSSTEARHMQRLRSPVNDKQEMY